MFRRMISVSMMVALGAVLVMTGCAKVPQAETAAANTALTAAENAEAATYAADELEQARAAMRQATAELQVQEQKFAMLRSYTTAQKLLGEATTAAEAAEQAAVANREAARSDASDAIAQLDQLMAAVDGDLEALGGCRRRPKGFAADLELLKGRADGMRTQLDSARGALNEARFNAAIEMADALTTEVQALADDLANARAKLKC